MRNLYLDDLTIDDERSLAGVAIYEQLKQALRRAKHRFQIPEAGAQASWDRVLFLNLTYWDGTDGSDVLCDEHIPADVVAHVAWHRVVGLQLAGDASDGFAGASSAHAASAGASGVPTAEGMFFAETIASAFDLYLVGRLLVGHPDSDFITTQVPLLAECAREAALTDEAFAALLEEVAREPERAFEDMRALLLDAARALFACADAASAQAALERLGGHRFAPLLHHYQLSNWILYARAYGSAAPEVGSALAALDATLRRAPVSLDWLSENWIDSDLVPAAAGRASRSEPDV